MSALRVLSLVLLVALVGCVPPVLPEAAGVASVPPTPAAELAVDVAPAIVAVRNAVQDSLPTASIAPPAPAEADSADACSTALIVRWEIGSPARYTARYEGVIWPGGHSGPTWGVGYDGGMQTRHDISADWREHPHVSRLQTASGVAGSATRARLGEWADIRTPFPFAADVFVAASLPKYRAGARRTYGPAFDQAPMFVRCALESNGYNRGFGTVGDRRAEIRATRDDCLRRNGDALVQCVAAQLRRQKRLWPEVRGLRDRREDEARTAERALASVSAPAPDVLLIQQRVPPPTMPARVPRLAARGLSDAGGRS